MSLGSDELVLILKYFQATDGSKSAHLCDLWYSDGGRDLIDSAISHWVTIAQNWRCDSLSCWARPGGDLDSVLDDYKFSKANTLNRWLVVNTGAGEKNQEIPCEKVIWNLSMGDSDVY
tara:strand:+ start:256 stop:609 length:354 start_codon:yes stop_codon:yes gene_type:complete